MFDFRKEIEDCLKNLCNTNNKEQNFQGRLYAHFLQFEKEGYVVEMETNVHDDHITFFPKDVPYEKKEIDLLIYKKDYSERYAAELKWIYHQNGSGNWTHLDNLPSFEKDVRFVRQLKKEVGFTSTCAVVVYDDDKSKQTRLRTNRKNKEVEEEYMKGLICGEHFVLNPLYKAFVYHIVSF